VDEATTRKVQEFTMNEKLLISALQKIIKLEKKDPEKTVEFSDGNYDDVFQDGIKQGEFYGISDCVEIAKEALKEYYKCA
jgi:hypothetical protein